MYIDVNLPLKGFSEILPLESQEVATSGYLSNVRPRDVLEKRMRVGQRPGLKKAYSQQIGGVALPIVALLSVTTVD